MTHKNWREEQAEALNELSSIHKLKPIRPGHHLYFKALEASVVTICVGPAGTGKSWIACGHAAKLLRTKKIDKIVITRPLVTCGRGAGFLPGDLNEKSAPYMRPLLDAFGDFFSPHELERHLNEGRIEMLPLDYMRGANIRNSVLICDEAQNAEFPQLHMLLTRFAVGTKVIVTGDISKTQTDLCHIGNNPLAEVIRRFQKHGWNESISLVKLGREDIVRHPLISWIDEALTIEEGDAAPDRDTWYSLKCPKCKAKLFYNNGDESDLSQDDVEHVRCYNCASFIQIYNEQGEVVPVVVQSVTGAANTFPLRP